MPSFEEKTVPGRDLFDKVNALSKYGNNAVFRRVLAVLQEELNLADVTLPCCGPDRDGCRPQGRTTMDLDEIIRETRQEDRRRSVLLDPSEALRIHLLDFYTGRLDVLEVREPASGPGARELVAAALDEVRKQLPVVSVNMVAAESLDDVIQTLRLLANNLESGRVSMPPFGESIPLVAVDTVTTPADCRLVSQTVTRSWENGGKRLVALYEIVTECLSHDKCCNNPIWTRNTTRDKKVEWEDTDSPDNKPPSDQIPPGFKESPWNNEVPLMEDPSNARFASDFGWRRLCDANGQNCNADFHGGIDVAAPVGSRVNAVNQGVVVYVDDSSHGAAQVVVLVGNQLNTYRHISPSVEVGDPVYAGDQVGTIRGGGNIHVHYEINNTTDFEKRSDNNAVNPLR